MGKKAAGKPKKGKNAVADAVLGDVTDTIQERIITSFWKDYDVTETKNFLIQDKGQKKILKEEMVAVIDRKLNEKIKDQLNEINELQETINRLKEGNNVVSFHLYSQNCVKITIMVVCH